jgi:CheY-like chemotaxis protein
LETVYRVGVPPCGYKLLPANLSGIRVLIVGEEAKNEAQILSKYLTEWDLQTTVVPSAAICLDKLSESLSTGAEPYELVFISQSIPDMKPFKLHKMIDRNIQFGHAHACVLTNKRKLGDRLSTQPVPIRRSKLHDYLGKFAARRHLYKKITPALERKDFAEPLTPRDINVLVVEDNAMAQVFASRILRKTGGYKVDSVTNGKQAVEAFKKGNFDIILMDCQMPELDGYSATKQIRDLEKETGGHVIIIAVTGMTMQEDRDRCFQMGMDDYLSKPVTNKDLIQKITQWSKQTRINKEEVEFGEFNTQQPAHKQMRPSATLFGSKRFDSAFPVGAAKDRLLM